MRYVYVTSARRNPDNNPKTNRHLDIDYWMEKENSEADLTYFVSFTSEPKIGVNPTSTWDTPIGVYTYPLRLLYNQIRSDIVPFGWGRPYIQILKRTSSAVLREPYSTSNYEKDLAKLSKIFNSKRNVIQSNVTNKNILKRKLTGKDPAVAIGKFEAQSVESFDAFVSFATDESKLDAKTRIVFQHNPIVKTWFLSHDLASVINPHNPAVTWNKILRTVGYNVAIDVNGVGFIHYYEPTQAVFLSPQSYKLVATVDNKMPLDRKPDRNYISNIKKRETKHNPNSYETRTVELPIVDSQDYEYYVDINPTAKNLRGSKIVLSEMNGKLVIDAGSILYTKKSSCLRDFIFRGQSATNIQFEGCYISGGKLQNCRFRNCQFNNSQYNIVSELNNVFSDCQFLNVISFSDSSGTIAEGCRFTRLDLYRQDADASANIIRNCIVLNASIYSKVVRDNFNDREFNPETTMYNTVFEHCTIETGELTDIKLVDCKLTSPNVNCRRCQFVDFGQLDGNANYLLLSSNWLFENGQISLADVSDGVYKNVQFTDCRILSPEVSVQYNSCHFVDCFFDVSIEDNPIFRNCTFGSKYD